MRFLSVNCNKINVTAFRIQTIFKLSCAVFLRNYRVLFVVWELNQNSSSSSHRFSCRPVSARSSPATLQHGPPAHGPATTELSSSSQRAEARTFNSLNTVPLAQLHGEAQNCRARMVGVGDDTDVAIQFYRQLKRKKNHFPLMKSPLRHHRRSPGKKRRRMNAFLRPRLPITSDG